MSRTDMQADSPAVAGGAGRTEDAVVGKADRRREGTGLRILVVTFCIPPSRLVGAKRFEFLAREMVDRGHEAHLLGLRELGSRQVYATSEPSPSLHYAGWTPFLGRLAGTRVVRVLRRYWGRYIAPVDWYGGWILPATLKGIRLVRRHHIDVVVATGPSFASFVTAYLINRITKSALILDYRDPWGWYGNDGGLSSRAGTQFRMERAIVRAASHVVVVTDRLKADFLNRFPHIDRGRVHVITNGLYRRRDLAARSPEDGAFNIVYAGTFYGERNASYLIDAMAELKREGWIGKRGFRLHVFGAFTATDKERARERGVQELLEEWGFRPYDEVLGYLRGADLLYLPSGEEFPYAIPFKFFDYLSVERPIIAVAPPQSQLAEIVRQTGAGVVADIRDQGTIVEALKKMISEDGRRRARGSEGFLWGHLAERYLDLLRTAVNPRGAVQWDEV